MATNKMSLKLLIDTKANKVIFAEAGKDFVDFLFSLLSMPVGAVIKLLTNKSSSSVCSQVGSLGNVYQSLGNLNESYMQPNLSKDILLNPKVSASVPNIPLLIPDSDSKTTNEFYMCSNCCCRVANVPNVVCPRCRTNMSGKLTYVANNAASSTNGMTAMTKGYVQDLAMYMVSDDLSVAPLSMISGIQLLNKKNVSQFNILEERVVHVGMDEGLELLRVSLQSQATLTTVFLKKKGANKKC